MSEENKRVSEDAFFEHILNATELRWVSAGSGFVTYYRGIEVVAVKDAVSALSTHQYGPRAEQLFARLLERTFAGEFHTPTPVADDATHRRIRVDASRYPGTAAVLAQHQVGNRGQSHRLGLLARCADRGIPVREDEFYERLPESLRSILFKNNAVARAAVRQGIHHRLDYTAILELVLEILGAVNQGLTDALISGASKQTPVYVLNPDESWGDVK